MPGFDEAKVLVVESDPELRESLSAFMMARGYRCLLAKSIDEALEPLAQNDFRFTLLDLHLSGSAGPDVVPRLRLQGGDPGSIIGLMEAADGPDLDAI